MTTPREPEGADAPWAALTLDGQPGPALPVERARAEALIAAALAPGATVDAAPIARGARRPAARLAHYAAAAVVMLGLAASASAAVWWVARRAAVAPVAAPHPLPAPAARPPAPPALVREDAVPVPLPATPPPQAPRSAVARPERARDLLAEANALRTRAAYAAASARYAEAAHLAPGSLTAHAADVARADLALDHLARPAEALALYRAALRAKPGGPLAPEAQYGVARALRALGDAQGERTALEALLRVARDTGAGHAAQRRLDELGR